MKMPLSTPSPLPARQLRPGACRVAAPMGTGTGALQLVAEARSGPLKPYACLIRLVRVVKYAYGDVAQPTI